jgi:serine/threonine protein kinase
VLGILIYEMLTGKPPFTAEQGVQALTFQHLQKPPPPLPAAISADIRALIERLLAKTPQERPGDALQVRRVLETALNGANQQKTVILRSENGAASQATPMQPDTQHNGRSMGIPDGHSTSDSPFSFGNASRRTVVLVSVAVSLLLGAALSLSPFRRQTTISKRTGGFSQARRMTDALVVFNC